MELAAQEGYFDRAGVEVADDYAAVGQSFTGSGTVSLDGVAVAEGDFSGAGELSALDCPDARTLIPGQQLVCTATYTVTQADLNRGSIVNTASFVAVLGSATSQISYTASKGGVLAMTRELGVQFARQGIRVMFEDGSRVVLRLSGTGTEGATLRVYLERYAGTDQPHDLDPETALAPVIAAAEELALIREHTGRDRPDVTT